MNHSLIKALETYFQTDISEIALKKCSNGDVNMTYIAEYKSAKAIVKIQKDTDLPVLYENQILREEIGTKLCIENDIPCPEIIASSQQEGYIVTEYIDYPLLGDVWTNLNNQERLAVKEQALSLINKMNHINPPLFGALYPNGKIGQFSTWKEAFINIVDIALSDCMRYKVLSLDECIQIKERAEINCNSLTNVTQNPVFAHLDFHWKNIFYDPQQHRIAYVFDFGSSMSTVDYMGYYRLDGGFLYGTEKFYNNEISYPVE